ncbi:hypothetical protein SAMN05444339_11035 [Loktanella atrilutea]|uniref:Phage protein, HK97 gp10 family n=1 Tax=Loktanella atrilutea TaxID=366533 RepID=A0A1M5DKJ1_LOKAT|nr:hypothetical protein [Loktanella atrilutea]SHF67487.1 hypothetical protein SAMN05444339_11035 [Loktanella atrilutea]
MIAANEQNADDVAALARVLVPSGATGRAKAAIKSYSLGEEGAVIDFGPLSRILEGGTVPRYTKAGYYRGIGPALPFVNPALNATKAKRRARIRKIVREVLRNG